MQEYESLKGKHQTRRCTFITLQAGGDHMIPMAIIIPREINNDSGNDGNEIKSFIQVFSFKRLFLFFTGHYSTQSI